MKQPYLHIEQKGQGQPIVVLHGWGVNNQIFAPLQQALANYSAHYVDLPGFGDSQPSDITKIESTTEQAGDFCLAVVDDWVDSIMNHVPQGAIWIGWSLGGLVATRAAQKYPQQVSALVTIASSPFFVAEPEKSWPGIAPKILEQFVHQLQQHPKRTIERFLAIQAMGSDSAKQDIKVIKQLVLEKPLPKPEVLGLGLQLLQHVNLKGLTSEIKQPWLRLWGRKDTLVPLQLSSQLYQADHIQDIVFENASHAPFISHAEEFNTALCHWLNMVVNKH